ncbi:unnamed protein product [Coccothraustes coccothraustes]
MRPGGSVRIARCPAGAGGLRGPAGCRRGLRFQCLGCPERLVGVPVWCGDSRRLRVGPSVRHGEPEAMLIAERFSNLFLELYSDGDVNQSHQET